MDIDKLLDFISKATEATDALAAATDAVRKELQEAEYTARDIIDSYFDDLKEKQQKISADAAELRAKRSALEERTAGLSSALIAARVTGDTRELQEIQDEISSIEIEKAAIDAELQLLSNTPMPGDTGIYEAAIEADEECKNEINASAEFYTVLYSTAKEQLRIWERLQNAALYRTHYPGDIGYLHGWSSGESRMQKMKEHHAGQLDALKGEDRQPGPPTFTGQNLQTNTYTFGALDPRNEDVNKKGTGKDFSKPRGLSDPE